MKYALRYAVHHPANAISLHCPEYVEPDKNDSGLVERIFCAFRRMKEDQPRQSEYYLPSSMWQAWLSEAYASLTDAMVQNDVMKFHYFLANFGVWDKYTGVESSTLIRNNMKSAVGRMFLKNEIFYRLLQAWSGFYSNRKVIACLTYPMYGNQAGAYIDGVFVGVGSFFNEIYGSMLSELIRGMQRPVIAELGAGYGKLAYFTLRDLEEFVFIDFDLPETLCLASYYLMKVYPEKRVLLYGEDDYGPHAHTKYDMIFLPGWEIEKSGLSTVDLFINKNGLGEMTRAAVSNYIGYISKATRYFFHMNHEITRNAYANEELGLLGYEYPVPIDEFTLLFRYPDIGHMLYDQFLYQRGLENLNMDIFVYLYERRAGRAA